MTQRVLELGIDGLTWKGKALQVNTPAALEQTLAKLKELGFEVKSIRDTPPGDYLRDDLTNSELVKQGKALWHVTLPRLGKCNSCNAYISCRGIRMHGHPCEKCGVATYYHIIDGSIVRLEFKGEAYDPWPLHLRMTAVRLDEKEGFLYLRHEFVDRGDFDVTGKRAAEIFEANSDKWELVRENGMDLIKIRYSYLDRKAQKKDPITVRESGRSVYNHRIVQVWKGKEYDEYMPTPVIDSFGIHETWHGAS